MQLEEAAKAAGVEPAPGVPPPRVQARPAARRHVRVARRTCSRRSGRPAAARWTPARQMRSTLMFTWPGSRAGQPVPPRRPEPGELLDADRPADRGQPEMRRTRDRRDASRVQRAAFQEGEFVGGGA